MKADELRTVLDRIEGKLDRLLAGGGAARAASSSGGGEVAPDRDLDSEWGDPEIKKDPKRWNGEPLAPIRMSEAPSDYLDVVAEFFEWQAGEDDKKEKKDAKGRPKSYYARKDAARARGWALRNAGKDMSQVQRQPRQRPGDAAWGDDGSDIPI